MAGIDSPEHTESAALTPSIYRDLAQDLWSQEALAATYESVKTKSPSEPNPSNDVSEGVLVISSIFKGDKLNRTELPTGDQQTEQNLELQEQKLTPEEQALRDRFQNDLSKFVPALRQLALEDYLSEQPDSANLLLDAGLRKRLDDSIGKDGSVNLSADLRESLKAGLTSNQFKDSLNPAIDKLLSGNLEVSEAIKLKKDIGLNDAAGGGLFSKELLLKALEQEKATHTWGPLSQAAYHSMIDYVNRQANHRLKFLSENQFKFLPADCPVQLPENLSFRQFQEQIRDGKLRASVGADPSTSPSTDSIERIYNVISWSHEADLQIESGFKKKDYEELQALLTKMDRGSWAPSMPLTGDSQEWERRLQEVAPIAGVFAQVDETVKALNKLSEYRETGGKGWIADVKGLFGARAETMSSWMDDALATVPRNKNGQIDIPADLCNTTENRAKLARLQDWLDKNQKTTAEQLGQVITHVNEGKIVVCADRERIDLIDPKSEAYNLVREDFTVTQIGETNLWEVETTTKYLYSGWTDFYDITATEVEIPSAKVRDKMQFKTGDLVPVYHPMTGTLSLVEVQQLPDYKYSQYSAYYAGKSFEIGLDIGMTYTGVKAVSAPAKVALKAGLKHVAEGAYIAAMKQVLKRELFRGTVDIALGTSGVFLNGAKARFDSELGESLNRFRGGAFLASAGLHLLQSGKNGIGYLAGIKTRAVPSLVEATKPWASLGSLAKVGRSADYLTTGIFASSQPYFLMLTGQESFDHMAGHRSVGKHPVIAIDDLFGAAVFESQDVQPASHVMQHDSGLDRILSNGENLDMLRGIEDQSSLLKILRKQGSISSLDREGKNAENVLAAARPRLLLADMSSQEYSHICNRILKSGASEQVKMQALSGLGFCMGAAEDAESEFANTSDRNAYWSASYEASRDDIERHLVQISKGTDGDATADLRAFASGVLHALNRQDKDERFYLMNQNIANWQALKAGNNEFSINFIAGMSKSMESSDRAERFIAASALSILKDANTLELQQNVSRALAQGVHSGDPAIAVQSLKNLLSGRTSMPDEVAHAVRQDAIGLLERLENSNDSGEGNEAMLKTEVVKMIPQLFSTGGDETQRSSASSALESLVRREAGNANYAGGIPELRLQAVEALAALRSESSIPVFKQLLSRTTDGAQMEPSGDVRIAALQAMNSVTNVDNLVRNETLKQFYQNYQETDRRVKDVVGGLMEQRLQRQVPENKNLDGNPPIELMPPQSKGYDQSRDSSVGQTAPAILDKFPALNYRNYVRQMNEASPDYRGLLGALRAVRDTACVQIATDHGGPGARGARDANKTKRYAIQNDYNDDLRKLVRWSKGEYLSTDLDSSDESEQKNVQLAAIDAMAFLIKSNGARDGFNHLRAESRNVDTGFLAAGIAGLCANTADPNARAAAKEHLLELLLEPQISPQSRKWLLRGLDNLYDCGADQVKADTHSQALLTKEEASKITVLALAAARQGRLPEDEQPPKTATEFQRWKQDADASRIVQLNLMSRIIRTHQNRQAIELLEDVHNETKDDLLRTRTQVFIDQVFGVEVKDFYARRNPDKSRDEMQRARDIEAALATLDSGSSGNEAVSTILRAAHGKDFVEGDARLASLIAASKHTNDTVRLAASFALLSPSSLVRSSGASPQRRSERTTAILTAADTLAELSIVSGTGAVRADAQKLYDQLLLRVRNNLVSKEIETLPDKTAGRSEMENERARLAYEESKKFVSRIERAPEYAKGVLATSVGNYIKSGEFDKADIDLEKMLTLDRSITGARLSMATADWFNHYDRLMLARAAGTADAGDYFQATDAISNSLSFHKKYHDGEVLPIYVQRLSGCLNHLAAAVNSELQQEVSGIDREKFDRLLPALNCLSQMTKLSVQAAAKEADKVESVIPDGQAPDEKQRQIIEQYLNAQMSHGSWNMVLARLYRQFGEVEKAQQILDSAAGASYAATTTKVF